MPPFFASRKGRTRRQWERDRTLIVPTANCVAHIRHALAVRGPRALPLARQHYCSDWTSLTARPRSCDADPKSVACSQGLADGPGLAFSIPTGEEGAEPLPSTEFKRAQPTTDTKNTARATMAHLERPRPVRRELLCFVSYSVGVPFDPSC